MRPLALTAAAAAAVPLLLTACSSASSSPGLSSSARSSQGPNSTSSASAAASPAGNPLAALTADQIASKVNRDLEAASSFRVSGSISVSGEHVKLNLKRAPGDCAGTITINGSTVGLVQIGSKLWVDPDGGGQYIETTSGNADYGQVVGLCSPGQLAGILAATYGLTKGGTTVIDGQSALELKEGADIENIYVTDSATPEYVRYDIPGSEQLDFSGFNTSIAITPPPASQTLP
jgi:hypothetical protein